MKRFATGLVISLTALMLVFTPVVGASDMWQFDTSTPKSTGQPRTFRIEFVTLSTDENDDITVKLYQDNVEIDSVTTTEAFGDSGAFTVALAEDGTHDYFMEATSSAFSETETSPTRSVAVEGDQVIVTEVEGGGAGAAGGGGAGAAAGGGDVQGATDENTGQVPGDAATTGTGDVLGAEDQAKADDTTNDSLNYALILIAILIALYYLLYYRKGQKNPFRKNHDI